METNVSDVWILFCGKWKQSERWLRDSPVTTFTAMMDWTFLLFLFGQTITTIKTSVNSTLDSH